MNRIYEYLISWIYFYYTRNECFKHVDVELKNQEDKKQENESLEK